MEEQYLEIAESLIRLLRANKGLENAIQRGIYKPPSIDHAHPHLRVAETLGADDSHEHNPREISNVLDKNLDVTRTLKETRNANGSEDIKDIPKKHAKACLKRCPLRNLNHSKASGTSTSTERNDRTRSLCKWCRQNLSDKEITPEKALKYVIEEIAWEILGMKMPYYSKMINNFLMSNVGALFPTKDGFVISQIHLKLILESLFGITYPMKDIPMYLRGSSLKYVKDSGNWRRTSVLLKPTPDLVKEFITNAEQRRNLKRTGYIYKKSSRYRFYFDDLEGLADFDWRKGCR